jgi:hypothetical protein
LIFGLLIAVVITTVVISTLVLVPTPSWLANPARRKAIKNRIGDRRSFIWGYLTLATGVVVVLLLWAMIDMGGPMNEHVAAVLRAAMWPVVAVVGLLLLRRPLRQLLTAAMLKSIKLKVFGFEFELSREEADQVLGDLLKEIRSPVNALTPEEKELFERIVDSDGLNRVDQIIEGFRRDTPGHEQLRKLRDLQLVRPIEGGRWKPEKHPVVTRFGHIVHDIVMRTGKPEESPGAQV